MANGCILTSRGGTADELTDRFGGLELSRGMNTVEVVMVLVAASATDWGRRSA